MIDTCGLLLESVNAGDINSRASFLENEKVDVVNPGDLFLENETLVSLFIMVCF